MKKTTVYLPDELKERVEEVARSTGKPEASVIRDAISSATRDAGSPSPRVPLMERGLGDATIAENVDALLSISDDVVARAQEVAGRRGMSVHQMIREYLKALGSEMTVEEILGELEHLWRTSSGDSAGQTWTREDLHDRSVR